MRISAKTEYAAIAVLELAARFGGEPMQVRRIAEDHGIPQRFLVQILLQLKGAGIVTSTRGASGGYRLAKEPKLITLWDVMKVIDGREDEVATNTTVNTPTTNTVAKSWRAAFDAQKQVLQSLDFGTLVDQVRNQADMYYI